MAYIELINVCKSFGNRKILSNISLKVYENDIIGIFGPNGSGKTTLLRIIAGILKPDSGIVKVNGSIGFVFQENVVLPWKTLFKNIVIGLKKVDIEYIRKLAKEFEIEQYLNMYPSQVSGGTLRKVVIIRALIRKPDILLLDEPFIELDLKSTCKLIDIVKSCSKCAIIVSHQLYELATICTKLYLLYDGKLHEVNVEVNDKPEDKIKKMIELMSKVVRS